MEQLPENRVDVDGTARRTVAADRVVWSLAVAESGDRPADAFARAGERLDALTRGLRDELGDGAEVRTGRSRCVPSATSTAGRCGRST